MDALTVTLPLSKGLVAWIDAEDLERVGQFKWTASREGRDRKWYAIRWSRKCEHGERKRYKIRLHHAVLGIGQGDLPYGEVVDHDDDNGLNCRKGNLKRMTQRENMLRSPGWKRSGKAQEEPFL